MRVQVLRDLLKLPVVTESGTALGRVSEVEIEPDSAMVLAYWVSPTFVKGLLSNEQYLITPSQVVSITSDKMVVKDGAVKQESTSASVLKKMALPHKPTPLTSKE